jgi:hypothetical protein
MHDIRRIKEPFVLLRAMLRCPREEWMKGYQGKRRATAEQALACLYYLLFFNIEKVLSERQAAWNDD